MHHRYQYAFTKNFFGGLESVSSKVDFNADNASGREFLRVSEIKDSKPLGIGPIVTYDSRDSTFYPHSGMRAEVKWLTMSGWSDADESYDGISGQYLLVIVQSRHKYASRVYCLHWLMCFEKSYCGAPCGRACSVEHADMLQCHADFLYM